MVSVQKVEFGYNRRNKSVKERGERESGERKGASERERGREREKENGGGEGEGGEERENLKIVRFTQIQLFLDRKKILPFLANPFVRQRGQECSLN